MQARLDTATVPKVTHHLGHMPVCLFKPSLIYGPFLKGGGDVWFVGEVAIVPSESDEEGKEG